MDDSITRGWELCAQVAWVVAGIACALAYIAWRDLRKPPKK